MVDLTTKDSDTKQGEGSDIKRQVALLRRSLGATSGSEASSSGARTAVKSKPDAKPKTTR